MQKKAEGTGLHSFPVSATISAVKKAKEKENSSDKSAFREKAAGESFLQNLS